MPGKAILMINDFGVYYFEFSFSNIILKRVSNRFHRMERKK